MGQLILDALLIKLGGGLALYFTVSFPYVIQVGRGRVFFRLRVQCAFLIFAL